MEFHVIHNKRAIPTAGHDVGYLVTDTWDDFGFKTAYVLFYFDTNGERHRLGEVKIGQLGMKESGGRTTLPSEFRSLGVEFFSLGQDTDYYEAIGRLGIDTAAAVLKALRDVVADNRIYQGVRTEAVTKISLMRTLSQRTVIDQLRRIVDGGARLTPYAFRFVGPAQLDPSALPLELTFDVEPNSKPSSNIHVIVGRNGVGKSHLLNAMSRALVILAEDTLENGRFVEEPSKPDTRFDSPFANVVSVSFSAFDDFPMIGQGGNGIKKEVGYTNVGLRKLVQHDTEPEEAVTQRPDELAEGFITSLTACIKGAQRQKRLRCALKTLESDPVFKEANVYALLSIEPEDVRKSAKNLFRRLSSGHKIVLLTLTKLIEQVDERTLVVMDEPEAHLHPPLLAALIRAISDLLTNRNGVAIIATHSPVVLQEVPKNCVWKLRRVGGQAVVERPEIETFAESVGHLTHEVFGLEVTHSGFYKLISDSIDTHDTYEDVLQKFDSRIGLEGRALISARIAEPKPANNPSEE